MTRMLASVIDELELESAIDAGADIIDLKNPHTGALGALPLTLIRHLVEQSAGRRPISATVGDLPADPLRITRAIQRTAECGVDFVKVGFFSSDNLSDCLKAIAELSADHAVVAVLFADCAPPLQRLDAFAAAGCRGVMLDTAGKGGGGLLQYSAPEQLERFVDETRALGMLSGLAGSLRLEEIPQLLPLLPDYLGFRGALCKQGVRTAGITSARLREVRDALTASPPPFGQALSGG
jgi:dihydroneopterin aldolase